MSKPNIMTVASLKKLLEQLRNELSDDYQIWLSSDEEGNEYLPMFENPRFSLAVDKEAKRIILFPSHR